MRVADIFWMLLILGGSAWLLWHFLWKKQGSCPGCNHAPPPRPQRNTSDS